MKEEIEIEYKGIKLLVEGTYEEGEEETWEHPGAASEFDVNSIFVGDVDIYDLFSAMDLEDIVELVISKIEG